MGTYLNKGIDFANGDQVTADKLDSLVESATFGSGAVDNSSTQLSGGAIIVKDGGITTSKIASGVSVSFADGSSSAPSITNAGDSNTGICFPGEDILEIACGGNWVSQFKFNEQGGEMILQDRAGGGDLLVDNYNSIGRFLKVGSGNAEYGTFGTGTVSLLQNTATRLFIANGGNVGIGTTTPAAKLHVAGDATVDGTLTASSANIAFADGSAAAPSITNAGDSNTGIYFSNADQVDVACGGSNILNLSSQGVLITGDVGISTSVAKPSGFNKFIAIGDTDTGIGQISDGVLALASNNTEIVRFTSGNVGIGTSSPATKLHVVGDVTVNGTITASSANIAFADGSAAAPSITNSGDTDTGLYFGGDNTLSITAGGSAVGFFSYNEQGGELQIFDSTGNGPLLIDNFNGTGRFLKNGTGDVEYGSTGSGKVTISQNNVARITILDGGNVGIGTTSPATKLDVNGAITVGDGVRGGLKYETSIATTSGTNIDFTSIPSWVKRISVVLSNVSTNGTSELLMQLGDSGGFETNGYIGSVAFDAARQSLTNGIGLGTTNSAAYQNTGIITLVKVTSSGNKWVASGIITQSGSTYVYVTSSSKETSDTLTSLRITTAGGVNTFDAGEINLIYEG